MTILMCALLLAQADAKALYDKVEAKLAASSVRFSFTSVLERSNLKSKYELEGTAVWDDRRRARVELTKNPMDITGVVLLSDGSRQKVWACDCGHFERSDAPADLPKRLASYVARMGAQTGLFYRGFTSFPSAPTLSDFEAKGDDIRWRAKCDDEPAAFDVTLTIDRKTLLPARRVVVRKLGDVVTTITETYSNWALDAKLADELFKLD